MKPEENGLIDKPTGNPSKTRVGIGMPAALYLQQFGQVVFEAFGEWPYHVGSSLTGMQWRDVDVRLMLSDEAYAKMGFGDPRSPHENARWVAHVLAFTELGRKMTGLPIDFQIQDTTVANERNQGHRSSLILEQLRRQRLMGGSGESGSGDDFTLAQASPAHGM